MTGWERLVLIGHPVAHSLSPVMQNAALDAAGIKLRYEAVDVPPKKFAPLLRRLSQLNCAGNITIPHKKTAVELMGSLSEAAAGAQAVNTFWSDVRQGGMLRGDNTDVEGFTAIAEALLGGTPHGCRISVIGSGGGAAAVLAAAGAWRDCEVTVHARNEADARNLCAQFSACVRSTTMADPAISEADIIVNATPVGLDGVAQPIDVARLSRAATVIDLVYGRDETPWVRAARASGLRASDGLPLLVRQGAASFRRWFGLDPDEDVMWRAVLRATGRLRTV